MMLDDTEADSSGNQSSAISKTFTKFGNVSCWWYYRYLSQLNNCSMAMNISLY